MTGNRFMGRDMTRSGISSSVEVLNLLLKSGLDLSVGRKITGNNYVLVTPASATLSIKSRLNFAGPIKGIPIIVLTKTSCPNAIC
jgi:hypothetical protein